MTTPSPLRQATSLFQSRFASRPAVAASAPGRVNLLGEHTDYNGGPVLPFAIERRVVVVASQAEDWLAVSGVDGQLESFDPGGSASSRWTDFPRAAARVMTGFGLRIPGAHLAVASTLPVGAGLSSSAALSLASVRALALLAGLKLSLADLVEIAWRVEHDELGVPCGRMDQTVVANGVRGSALLIECATGQIERVPLPGKVWIFDTGTTHRLADSDYPRRRQECAQALVVVQERGFSVRTLAELSVAQLSHLSGWLPPPLDRRTRHVVTETARTRAAAKALAGHDLAELGRLMVEGHRSLRDDFQSSTVEADLIVESVMQRGGLGARLTGAGWGGAVVALIPGEREARIVAEVTSDFRAAAGRELPAWAARASAGVRREQVVSG